MDELTIIVRTYTPSIPLPVPRGRERRLLMSKLNPSQESHGNRLRRLRSFCYAAQTGSISRAAEQAMLSQPSVSLQIQALELEFKAKLFQRRGPKILLTPEGQALYKLAWPLVDAVDSLTATFHASQSGIESGRLTIAAGESTILYILPETIKRVRAGPSRHRAPAPERHRPRRPEDASQRRRGFRCRLDDRGPRGHQLHADVSL